MIRIENLSKNFKKNKVLRDLDLNLEHTGITALLGPNGSGKTTLVKSILGLVIPDEGRIFVNGHQINGQFDYRNQISYLPQIAKFPENLTVRELLDFMRNIRSNAVNEAALIERFDLGPEMQKKTSMLSGGTRQKLNLVLSFMYDSPFMLLDEPSTGLDPLALISLKNLLEEEKQKGKQILLITHILSLVEELADNVIFILEGKIYYQGSIKELIEKQNVPNLETAIANILR